MGILDQLFGVVGNIAPRSPVQGSQMPFKTNLVVTDGDSAYDTVAEVVAIIGALAAGSVWTKIWEKTVPAQQKIRYGFGSPEQPYNQGYMWFCSLDTNVDFQVGKLRLDQANSRETRVITVAEIDDTALHGTTVTTLATATPQSKENMIALPEKVEFPRVAEDSKLQLRYRCITAATAEDNVGFGIPCTVYQ